MTRDRSRNACSAPLIGSALAPVAPSLQMRLQPRKVRCRTAFPSCPPLSYSPRPSAASSGLSTSWTVSLSNPPHSPNTNTTLYLVITSTINTQSAADQPLPCRHRLLFSACKRIARCFILSRTGKIAAHTASGASFLTTFAQNYTIHDRQRLPSDS
jgi:hypothetical protein